MGHSNTQPFSVFGKILRTARMQQKKTSAEVSGAVEISEAQLLAFENGEKRPTEDILQLLIQHFNLQEDQAAEWWRLAGYGKGHGQYLFMNDENGDTKDIDAYLLEAEDGRIVYTDMVQIMVNNYGVIMNFMQGAGPSSRPLAVSRVGMSKEHARSVLKLLETTLSQADAVTNNIQIQRKELPEPKQEN